MSATRTKVLENSLLSLRYKIRAKNYFVVKVWLKCSLEYKFILTYVEKLLYDNIMFGLVCFVYVLHSWFILSTKYNVDHCLCFTQSPFYQKDISMLIAISIARFPGRPTFIRPTLMSNGEVWTYDRSLSSFRCHCRTKIKVLLL